MAITTRLSHASDAWSRFWFTPSDPTVLAAIRIVTGIVTLITLFAYGFLTLQELVGEHAWLDLPLRQEQYRETPVPNVPFGWAAAPLSPDTAAGKHPPATRQEQEYIDYFTRRYGVDPRDVREKGDTSWSVWYHVVDPFWMTVIHWAFVLCAVLFTIGLGTRITAVLTWFAVLSYTHRAIASVFGADTMMSVLLLYLMIGPSGAALSVDRWLACWRAKRAGLPAPALQPLVSNTLAVRLIQIHACIIYLAAGVSKLQGFSWWSGQAPWGSIANFEYAPIDFPLYIDFLRGLARTRWLYELLMTVMGLGTLTFEIGYAFLIWRPGFRTLWLWIAVVLHLGIGLFMGLRTFSVLMLAFNLAFVSPATVRWALAALQRLLPGRTIQEKEMVRTA